MWWPGLGVLLQLLNVSNAKVADTNSLAPALLVCSLQSSPHELPCFCTTIGAVNEE